METSIVETPQEAEELDQLLWEVLWKPLGFPRDIRQRFKIDGESIELVIKESDRIIGGLVAIWTGKGEIEIRHLAVHPDAQNQKLGRGLVTTLCNIVMSSDCQRVHTIARNTSVEFFRGMGFKKATGTPPEHSIFKKNGIAFELMELLL